MGKQSRKRRERQQFLQEQTEIARLDKAARYWDLMYRSAKDIEDVKDDLRQTVVIEATDVAKWLLDSANASAFDIVAAPLYPIAWVEFAHPPTDDVFCASWMRWTEWDKAAFDNLEPPNNTKWLLFSMIYQIASPLPLAECISYLDENGRLADDSVYSAYHKLAPNNILGDGTTEKEFLGLIGFTLSTALAAFTFAHTRNIELIDNKPDFALSGKYERHYGTPLTKYKTLRIIPTRKGRERADKPQEQFDIMPLHIRRGHFQHAPDHPIANFRGTRWIPSMVVGNEKNGVVGKGYKVKP